MRYLIRTLKESKFIFLIILFSCTSTISAQDNFNLELNMSRSKHGSGDLSGFNFSVNFVKPIKKNLSYVISVGGSTHQQKKELFFTIDGIDNDGSILYVTSGFQVGFGLDYKFINFDKHKFGIRLIPFGRYQSTSLPDVVTILYPIITDLPIPVIYFEQTTPSQTIAVGLNTSLFYNIKLHKTLSLNLLGSFQFDSNGDNIIGYGLGLVKSF